MTTQTVAKPEEKETAVQDLLVTEEADKAASSLLPPQFNDAYMAAFIINVRLGI